MATLLGDIGGTNARFALLDGGAWSAPVTLALDRFPDIAAAIAAFLGGATPAGAVLAVAGPVEGNRVRLTNRGWVVDGDALAAGLGLGRVRVINDFTALAWSLGALGPGDLRALGGGAGVPGAPLAVLGPGTGLGVGGFLPPDRALVSEGGHASLATHDTREAAVVDWLRARHGHVSAERVLSGPGLAALHAALRAVDGLAPEDPPPDAPAVTARALAGRDPVAVEALGMFCAILGGVAGDLALTFDARGGVFIAGGICPRLPEFLAASRFRARFAAKGRFGAWLAPVPTWLVMRPDPAMAGLARLARMG